MVHHNHALSRPTGDQFQCQSNLLVLGIHAVQTVREQNDVEAFVTKYVSICRFGGRIELGLDDLGLAALEMSQARRWMLVALVEVMK